MKFKKKHKIRIIIALVAVFIIAAYIIFDSAIRNAAFSLAETRLKAIASRSINDAVKNSFSGISYSDLVNIEKDETGNIISLSANAGNINSLASEVSLAVQDEITNAGMQGIDIPIGTVIGGRFFSGYGPSINVRFEPVSVVNTEFLTAFEEAGINQTRQLIYLVIHVNIKTVLANTVEQEDYSSKQIIADTVIVGKIPEQYMRSDSAGGMQSLAPMLLMDKYSEDNEN